MAESKEYSTIVKCRRKLEIALESDRDIAQFLLQQGFITQERGDEVINPKSNLTDADKASMLVTAIRNRVELNPHKYHEVVDHLRQNIIRYGDIVEILDQQYHQTTAVGSPLQPEREIVISNDSVSSTRAAPNEPSERTVAPELCPPAAVSTPQPLPDSCNEIIEKNIQYLEGKFGEIADTTFDQIKKKNPDVDTLVAKLLSPYVKYQKQHKIFFQQLTDFVEKDTTTEKIWMKLSGYWNFLNYTLLENLVHKFGDLTLKADMKKYVKDLRKFRNETRLCEFTRHFSIQLKEHDLQEHDLQDFVIKLEQRWDEYTLEDLEKLKESITQEFFFPSFAMRIRSIKSGCIVVTWTIPTLIASALKEKIKNIAEFYKENGIVYIVIDGKEFSEGTASILTTPTTQPPSNSSHVPSKRFSTDPFGIIGTDVNDRSGKCATAEIVDSKDIRSKFSFLLFHTMRSLITEKVLIQDLKVLLLPYKTSELNESDDDVRKILLKAFHNCSFFSFKIVRDIIDHLGTNDDKERLAKYEESFKDYCKDGVPTEVPLEEVCVIQSEISRILGKPIHLKGEYSAVEEKFPYLKSVYLSEEERSMLMGRLIVDSKDIQSKFSSLLFHTERSLTSEKVSIRSLKVLLLPYKISYHESDDDVSKILLKAFQHCSLFSFQIVRDIIDHLGTSDDKERLAEYEASFKDYCKRRLCEVPSEVLNPGESGEFYVETDEIFDIQLEEVCVIQSEISRILGRPIHLKGKYSAVEERFPYLKSEHLSEKEKSMLMGRLVMDSKDIRSKFSSLLFHTERSLTSVKVLIQSLKIVLKPYKISKLDESDDDISKILLKAFQHCSLFSFQIVRDIIDHLGTNDDKERLAEYEASFKDYCKRRLFEVPTEVLNPGESGEKKEFYVETDEIFNVQLEEVCVVQSEISRILEKPIHLMPMAM